MTVKELIEQLKGLPEDREVLIPNRDPHLDCGDYCSVCDLFVWNTKILIRGW